MGQCLSCHVVKKSQKVFVSNQNVYVMCEGVAQRSRSPDRALVRLSSSTIEQFPQLPRTVPLSVASCMSSSVQSATCSLPNIRADTGFKEITISANVPAISLHPYPLHTEDGYEILFFIHKLVPRPRVWCLSRPAWKPASKPGVCPQVLSSKFPLTPAL